MAYALAIGAFGCGGYQRQWVERPPLVTISPEPAPFELVDVHLAGVSQTPDELLELRRKTLPVLRASATKVLDRNVALGPGMNEPRPPLADAWQPCIAGPLPGDGWKVAIAVSERTKEVSSLLAAVLDSKAYMITVAIAVWDRDGHLVDHDRITFTKDEEGRTATHAAAPPDDELTADDTTTVESAGTLGDPLWLKAVAAALPEYLARFRASRVRRVIREGVVYTEPPDRARYRASRAARPPSPRCGS